MKTKTIKGSYLMKIISNTLCLAFFSIILGCGSASIKTSHDSALKKIEDQSIDQVVIIPVKITVKESGIGSLEKLPEESELATKIVEEELAKVLHQLNVSKTLILKAKNEDETNRLDEYVALYERVATSAQFVTYAGDAWKHKLGDGGDYTLGSDISYIMESTGIDKAVFVFGEDIVTSGGKKALALLAILGGVGVNPGGVAVVHIGIVDLNDGSLLWSNTIANQSMSLTNRKSVNKAILETLEDSPLSKEG